MDGRSIHLLEDKIKKFITSQHYLLQRSYLEHDLRDIITNLNQPLQLTTKQKIHLLSLSNNKKFTLGMVIAKHYMGTKGVDLLSVFGKMIDDNVDPDIVLKLLLQSDDSKHSLFMLILHSNSDKYISNLLKLMMRIVTKNCSFTMLERLFCSSDYFGNTITTVIAMNRSETNCSQYLQLIKLIFKKHGQLEFIYRLLSPRDENKTPLILMLPRKTHLLRDYLDLLKTIYQSGGDGYFLKKQLYIHNRNKNWSLIKCVVENQNAILAFHLIDSGLLHKDYYREFMDLKELIFDYICTFPLKKRERVLKNALNKSHPLGVYFSMMRGFIPTSDLVGLRGRIIDELDDIKNQKLMHWQKLFYTPHITERENGINRSHTINVDTNNINSEEEYIPSMML